MKLLPHVGVPLGLGGSCFISAVQLGLLGPGHHDRSFIWLP